MEWKDRAQHHRCARTPFYSAEMTFTAIRELKMEILYTNFQIDDIGSFRYDHLMVSVNADITIRDEKLVVYNEDCFPVLELAAHLHRWVSEDSKSDFEFHTMVSDEVGLVAILRRPDGWVVASSRSRGVESCPVPWQVMKQDLYSFIDAVAKEMNRRGFDPRYYIYKRHDDEFPIPEFRVPCPCYFGEPCNWGHAGSNNY
mgnify:CR=1 FL=1